MAVSYTKKALQIDIELNNGLTKSFTGLACKVSVQKLGLPDKNKASISIMGLSYDDMATATTIAQQPFMFARNHIAIWAGEQGQSLTRIFSGNISSAWADFNTAPDPTMKIEAMTGGFASLMSQAPMATSGETKAADVVQQMAATSGFSFKNQGVDSALSNTVLSGSPIEKAKAAADQVGADLIIDDEEMILLPKGEARQTAGGTILVSPTTGMIGYPTFGNMTLSFKCFFNPNIQRGGLVQVESIVPKASGEWRVSKVTHNLTAYDPKGGPWETVVEGTYGWRFLGGIQ